ncbi:MULTISPECIES: beta family protein [unclassified Bradyrhizobium]|uniref:beta family protein n=1 Tax=unclassified Bradyrhizobium TaxID=2631580 RepID=UPI0028ED3DFB|nr:MULTISPECIES: hypothetical protein [unclassified Bradyrhizobium]
MSSLKYTYRPQLRSKSGEAAALNNLSSRAKSRLAPVINMVTKPPAGFANDITAAWGGGSMALDGSYNVAATGSTSSFANLFGAIGTGGVKLIPAINMGETGPYLGAVTTFVGSFGPGLVLRAKLSDLPTVGAYAAAQGWATSDIDLIVDLKEVQGYDPSLLYPMVETAMIKNIASGNWRSVTLAASSAPRDNSGLPQGRSVLPRQCWKVWEATAKAVPYILDFSDYGTGTPDLSDPPGLAMTKATVSARYTVDDSWIIRKGKPTNGKNGEAMPKQYKAHAAALIAEPQFGGLSRCWGDDRILQIRAGTATPGNRTTWASIGASRHLNLINARLP